MGITCCVIGRILLANYQCCGESCLTEFEGALGIAHV